MNMLKFYAQLLIILTLFTQPLHAWWWGKSQPPTLETVIQDLQQKQADHPEDPYTNYNLGVALYKASKFSQAQTNFDRALVAATHPELKKRCYFNMGNSLYKDAVTSLPDNWENVEVPADTLDMALAKTSLAIKKYDSVLLLDKEHQPAKTNQKAAKNLLEKLEKKKQQQEKDKKDKKQDPNKDKDKQKDQSKEQDKDKQQQQQKQGDNKDQDDKQKQQGNNGNEQQKKDTKPQNDNDKNNQGNSNQPKDEHGKDKQQQQQQQPQPSTTPDQKQDDTADQQPSQAQVSMGGKPETMEQRAARALLDTLQQDESKLQKALIVKQLKENEKPRESSQRPW